MSCHAGSVFTADVVPSSLYHLALNIDEIVTTLVS